MVGRVEDFVGELEFCRVIVFQIYLPKGRDDRGIISIEEGRAWRDIEGMLSQGKYRGELLPCLFPVRSSL